MSEEPRVAAGTWEEWEQARDRLTQEIVNEARCVWRNHKPGRCPYCAKNVAAARERLDTLHRAALARIAELEREVAARGKVIDIALNSAAALIDGEAHRAALEERDALRQRVADVLDVVEAEAGSWQNGWLPSYVCEATVQEVRKRIFGAALRSTVPAEPSLASGGGADSASPV